MSKPRIVFAGTPDFAAASLQALLANPKPDYELVAVYTQPDRPAGRGRKLSPSPVKQLALEHALPVVQPLNFKDPSALEELASFKPDLILVVAYGLLLPQAVLDLPRLGCINVHASLLPRWRGAAPIQRAILAGDTTTGITLMQMDAGLDTGAILTTSACSIGPLTTSASLHTDLAQLGGQALVDFLPHLFKGAAPATAQDAAQATYAAKLTKEEAQLNWQLSAAELDRHIRGYNPWPVAWFQADGASIRVWQAEVSAPAATPNTAPPGTLLAADKQGLLVACGAASQLRLTRLQLPGKPQMQVADLLNGNPKLFQVGQVLEGAATL